MVRLLLLATVAASNTIVQGHLHFARLAHNGVWQAPFRYIRNVTDPFYEPYDPLPDYPRYNRSTDDPTYYLDAPNSVRCGRGNLDHAADTEVLKVKAGDTIEFVAAQLGFIASWADARYWNCEDGRGFCTYFSDYDQDVFLMKIVHPGPVSTYLSAVPEGKKFGEYDGSGEWVKIHTTGVEILKDKKKPHWLPNNNTDENFATGTSGLPARMPFKIPSQTPAGQYLLRVDLVYNYGQTPAQMFPSCAQILVESTATGALPKGVKFPEVYDPKSPGMTTSPEQGSGFVVDKDYVYPGGDLWTGEKLVVDRPDLTPI